ncbi:MAG: hypothetical protein SGJ20_04815 [Planctomycetota bacterium]|nr:hypothetical protein [Planctomycetota bacterium]
MDGPLSDVLLGYLLDAVDGHRFERTIQDLLRLRDGSTFVPLGGVHDGGADGLVRETSEDSGKAGHFVQISIQAGVGTKIRNTVKRLGKVGREVHSLTYWSGIRVAELDLLEEELSKELGLTVRIRDRLAVFQLANSSKEARTLIQQNFRAEIFELTSQTKALAEQHIDFAKDPSVFVFLQFETGDRFSKGGLVVPIVDALIYWALRDTDPDAEKLLSRIELKGRIENLLPGAAANLVPHVDERLKILAAKSGDGFQRIRAYAGSDSYCLPYAMRLELASAGAAEHALQLQLRDSLKSRAKDAGAADPELVAGACEHVIYKHFSQQGLLLAAFLEKRLEGISISDQVVEAELQAAAGKGKIPDAKTYASALVVLRQVFYTPNKAEDDFLHRLARTSMLLFSLRHSPRLIEYFNQLAGNFNLLVGTDILVKALSESFLPTVNRHVTNVLSAARMCGAKLYLTESVLREMYTHLYATYREFMNHYAPREPYITPALASQSDRIFIRTYFYAKLLLKEIKGWNVFINQFVDPEELEKQSEKGENQLQALLCKKFSMEYIPKEEIVKGVDEEKVRKLTTDLLNRNAFKREELARNDAEMVHAVYARRKLGKEIAKYDGFGLRTWWLTKEFRVLAYTGEVVRDNGGIPYIMRPEFLLNFLTLAPKATEDPAAQQLLPSHVGLQIGQHLPSAHMQRILQEVDNWKSLSPERVEIKISDAVDRLKFDRVKRYENNLDLDGKAEADALIAALKAA